MADLTQTPGNIANGSSEQYLVIGTAGEALTAGDLIYQDSTDNNEWKKTDNSTAAASNFGGMAMASVSDGNPLVVLRLQKGVLVNPGATVAVGEIYVVSSNSGKWAPVSDLALDDYMSVIGLGVTTSLIQCAPLVSGYQHT